MRIRGFRNIIFISCMREADSSMALETFATHKQTAGCEALKSRTCGGGCVSGGLLDLAC